MKNALERGEPLVKAKQTFINAGYRPEEVEAAYTKVPKIASKISKPLSEHENKSVEKQQNPRKIFGKKTQKQKQNKIPIPSPKEDSIPKQKPPKAKGKQASKGLIAALIIMAVLVTIGIIYMAINWNNFF